uniref:Sperm membrane protein-B n=1 Tax=Oryctolagus cuniculus TaxID=9986 RepID=Q28630_RABIT|nr:sperm membrane protein-B [Oryctolagus cuniculus]AAA66524.1 sperm membrane protein-B [Oryctolagus cuniculus]
MRISVSEGGSSGLFFSRAFSGVLNVEEVSFEKAMRFLTLPSEDCLMSEFGGSSPLSGSTFPSDHMTIELISLLLFFKGALKLNPNKEPVAELLPNANGFDFSLLKMLLTDSEPNTNLGGETTAFGVVSEVLDVSPASEVVSTTSSP